jgi:hypothetical protein
VTLRPKVSIWRVFVDLVRRIQQVFMGVVFGLRGGWWRSRLLRPWSRPRSRSPGIHFDWKRIPWAKYGGAY